MPRPMVQTAASVPVGNLPSRLHAYLAGQLMVWGTKLVATGLVDLRLSGTEHIHASVEQGRPVIFAGWHGHNFLTMASYYAQVHKLFNGASIMVPDSTNGLAMESFGRNTNFTVIKVRSDLGASGWARATVAMIKLVRGGYCALLSPDGPSGPAYVVKPGIAKIAQQAKAVVIPASAAASRGVRLRKRWDEHLVPFPFARAIVHFSPPIDTSPPDGPRPSEDELQERIQAELTEGARKAQELVRKGSAAERRAR